MKPKHDVTPFVYPFGISGNLAGLMFCIVTDQSNQTLCLVMQAENESSWSGYMRGITHGKLFHIIDILGNQASCKRICHKVPII